VTKRRTEDWLTRWLRSSENMLASDPAAQALLKEYNNLPMPNQHLSPSEIRQFVRYFKWADAQPAGSLSSSGPGH
jgi:nitrite reductase (NO-forming)